MAWRVGEDSKDEEMAAGLSCAACGVGWEAFRGGAATWGRGTAAVAKPRRGRQCPCFWAEEEEEDAMGWFRNFQISRGQTVK